jgi:AraC-like DNA-binding protein
MTYYEKEISRLKGIYHFNQAQIDAIIGTRNYIDNNYNKEINLDLLSHMRYMSKFHLLRLFKRYYGQTPRQYLIAKRIEASKEFLRIGKTVHETCFSVGFESPGSFNTLFKNKTGKTPGNFQKEQFSRI